MHQQMLMVVTVVLVCPLMEEVVVVEETEPMPNFQFLQEEVLMQTLMLTSKLLPFKHKLI